MSTEMESVELWLFVIDTNMYAGNFDMKLAAYTTGRISYNVTDRDDIQDIINNYKKDMGIPSNPDAEFNLHIIEQPDDHGDMVDMSPHTLCPTPGWSNDGNGKIKQSKNVKYPAYLSVGIWMDRKPTDEECKTIMDRAKQFPSKCKDWNDKVFEKGGLKITGFRLIKKLTTTETVQSW